MLKTLKFRAFEKTTKTMMYFNQPEIIADDETRRGMFLPVLEPRKVIINGDLIWMEFTDVYDRNNREIYDGDIVKTFDSKELYRVGWGLDGAFWLISIKKYEGEHFSRRFGNFHHSIEIVGNIYENPDLLEVIP